VPTVVEVALYKKAKVLGLKTSKIMNFTLIFLFAFLQLFLFVVLLFIILSSHFFVCYP